MIKSIFVDQNKLEGIENSRANHLIISSDEGIDNSSWHKLKNLNMTLSLSLSAFSKDTCPADPDAQKKLFDKLNDLFKFKPVEIWLDGFRFGGECAEILTDGKISKIHQQCSHCKDIDRTNFLVNLAGKIISKATGQIKIGYFAIAHKPDQVNDMYLIGQDHAVLGKVFDMISPMLYYRMLGKPVEYISSYVRWIYNLTAKPILPIIQIKDMPDDLVDQMSEDDMKCAIEEAIKAPSTGVCIFWWNHALEKNKTEIVSKLLSVV